jgi:hypothetical protein|tara:strand:- start:4237 stop:4842 length:606 start_codon:yes stop_codon:yes gene_type:complete
LLSRSDIINHAIQAIKAKDYLEIGCAYNENFDKIKVKNKVGIDPNSGGTLRMTSDEFFAVNLMKYDVIFIDGLHEHKQVWQDFCNSVKILRPRGIIILHDMLPPGEQQAIWPFEEDQKNDAPRCGTSWRASFDILKLQKEYFIIDRETGIAIWRNNDVPNDIDFDSETITWNEFQECRSRMGFDVIDSTTGLQRMYKLRKL